MYDGELACHQVSLSLSKSSMSYLFVIFYSKGIRRSSNDKMKPGHNQNACYPANVSLLRLCQLQIVFHKALELRHAETDVIMSTTLFSRVL